MLVGEFTDRARRIVPGSGRWFAWAGVVAGLTAATAVLTLDASIGGRLLRGKLLRLQTISEYVYTPGSWIFVGAVLVLAAGSAALTIGLVRAGVIRQLAPGGILLWLWVIGLVGIVVFPKHNWAIGPSASGSAHRAASLIAFVALPLAVLLIVRTRHRRGSVAARAAWWLALGGLGCLTILLGAIVVASVTGARWWQLIPLGLVERGIAGFDVAAVIALGFWLARSASPGRPAD